MTPVEVRLADLALRADTMTYGALARELGVSMAELTAGLERLMEVDAAAGLPFRAVVCRARLGFGLPAEGFFAKAQSLGVAIPDRAAFVQAQRLEVHRRQG